MIAVIYDPTDGSIKQTVEGSGTNLKATADAMKLSLLVADPAQYDEHPMTFDAGYKVSSGKLVAVQ